MIKYPRRIQILLAVIAALASAYQVHAQMEPLYTDAVDFADAQMRHTLQQIGYATAGVDPVWAVSAPNFPKVTSGTSGDVVWEYQSRTGNWGAGFFPGLMWDLYDLTGDTYWLGKARAFTDGIEPLKTSGGDMQMNIGFHFMNSYARRIAHDGPAAGDLAVMGTAASHLATNSWMPAVGSLWSFSWNNGLKFDGLVGGWAAYKNTIIDSSPNIEILYYQAKAAGDTVMWDKAASHMANLVRDNIRPDGSTAQLTSYDTTTGGFLRHCGHQGYSYLSTWSRGQGWALHGFASAWRETRDPAHGQTFHALYTFYRDNAPADGVPYWDFDAPYLTDAELEFRYPGRSAPSIRYSRDSSAAALAASALLLACRLTEDDDLAVEYFNYARHILQTLSTPGFLACDETYAPLKESILRQGSYTFPGVDKGQIWGDFFYVEALRRYRDLVEPVADFDSDPEFGDLAGYVTASPLRWQVQADLGDLALRLQGRASLADTLPADTALYRFATYGDFVAQFEFRADELLAAGNPVDVVFIFGYEDSANFRFLTVSNTAGRSGLQVVSDGTVSSVASIGSTWSGSGYHTVTVSRVGGEVTVGVDAVSWGSFTDAVLQGGGFAGVGGMGNSLLFDGIGITGTAVAADLSPRAAWRAVHFAEPLSIIAHDGFDVEGDGRVNLLEYALGTDPRAPNGSLPGLAIAASGGGSLELSFPWNGAYSDISYSLMETTDGGATWHPVLTRVPAGGGGWGTAVHGASSAGPASLYRLEVGQR